MRLQSTLYILLLVTVLFTPVTHAAGVINTDDAQWCSYQNNCRYMGHVFYRSRSSQAKDHADEYLQRAANKRGGDTFVYQRGEVIKDTDVFAEGNSKRMVGFGNIYNCREKPGDTSALRARDAIELISEAYLKRCTANTAQQECHLIQTMPCKTGRDNPEYRCYHKALKKSLRTLDATRMVFRNESYDFNQYSVDVEIYNCKSKKVNNTITNTDWNKLEKNSNPDNARKNNSNNTGDGDADRANSGSRD